MSDREGPGRTRGARVNASSAMRRGVGVLPFLSALLSASLASESFSQAACAADGPPPTFALLLVGNFRTFYDPRVYKSIRTNLIDALGKRPFAQRPAQKLSSTASLSIIMLLFCPQVRLASSLSTASSTLRMCAGSGAIPTRRSSRVGPTTRRGSARSSR